MAEYDADLLREQQRLEEKQRQDPLPERQGSGSGGGGEEGEGEVEAAAGRRGRRSKSGRGSPRARRATRRPRGRPASPRGRPARPTRGPAARAPAAATAARPSRHPERAARAAGGTGRVLERPGRRRRRQGRRRRGAPAPGSGHEGEGSRPSARSSGRSTASTRRARGRSEGAAAHAVDTRRRPRSCCSAAGSFAAEKNALVVAKGEVPEARLVDVSIDLFAPGVSDTPPSPMLEKGIRASVRKSESRYIPTHLRNTLQSTGQWGAVRVVPGGAGWAELLVTGKILKSNGKDLELELRGERRHRPRLARPHVRAAGRHHGVRQGPPARRPRPVPGALQPHRQRPAARARAAQAEASSPTRARSPSCASPRTWHPTPSRAISRPTAPARRTIVRLPAADDPMLARVRGDPRARPHADRHAQRVLRRLLRADGQAVRRLARLQLRGAEVARLDRAQLADQEDRGRRRRAGGHLPARPARRPRHEGRDDPGRDRGDQRGLQGRQGEGHPQGLAQRARGLVRGRGHAAAGGRGRQGRPAHGLGGRASTRSGASCCSRSPRPTRRCPDDINVLPMAPAEVVKP